MSITLQIDKMSTTDRLQAMEELWDALCHEKHELESPSWHEEILNARKQRIKTGKAKFITLDELKKQFGR
ncbi:MAG TPA: hypothetical protein DD381_10675 [Lentisphaeria bacterium]|nr:MAG: hypothetical protein A2X47_02000 [Lentisphaerae bacterium GWF2_38_69]HBM16791.1 hypothetical protein [Lentisphaeria bacterium]